MPITPDQLYALMPAVHRLRDVERGEPLKALLAVLAEQAALVEDDIRSCTITGSSKRATNGSCRTSAICGARGLYSLRGTSARTRAFSQRARVANTIGYRRRKGTASMLEQLARDVTGWDARAVEFFELLATTQYLNHMRPGNVRTPDLHNLPTLELLDTPFDTIAHTAEVRHIASGRGKYNIPNIGLFLWRLQAYPLTQSPAVAVDTLRYFISPLGCNAPLFTHPVTEDHITHLAEPINVPDPISRLRLHDHLSDYYGKELSVLIEDNTGPIDQGDLSVCNLSDIDPTDLTKGWAHTPLMPAIKVAIDPVLGRIAFRDPPVGTPRVTFYYGFSADLGGGEYDRAASLKAKLTPIVKVPNDQATVQAAINQVATGGAVEIQDSGRYVEPGLQITFNAGQRVEVRSVNERRATIVLTNDFKTPQDLTISGDGKELILNGLLIIGGTVSVTGRLSKLTLRHCTLVPGLSVNQAGQPIHLSTPSLSVKTDADITTVEIDHCMTGPLDLAKNVNVIVRDSIVDGLGVALNVITGDTATIERSTLIGATKVKQLDLGSESIFTQPITVQRRQVGCVRFSYVPDKSITPRRYRCQPDLALKGVKSIPQQKNIRARLTPSFTALRYGEAAYAQLGLQCAEEITTGAEDGSEMGAFSMVKQAHRIANLRASLDEYLRFGLEAGIFFAS